MAVLLRKWDIVFKNKIVDEAYNAYSWLILFEKQPKCQWQIMYEQIANLSEDEHKFTL